MMKNGNTPWLTFATNKLLKEFAFFSASNALWRAMENCFVFVAMTTVPSNNAKVCQIGSKDNRIVGSTLIPVRFVIRSEIITVTTTVKTFTKGPSPVTTINTGKARRLQMNGDVNPPVHTHKHITRKENT